MSSKGTYQQLQQENHDGFEAVALEVPSYEEHPSCDDDLPCEEDIPIVVTRDDIIDRKTAQRTQKHDHAQEKDQLAQKSEKTETQQAKRNGDDGGAFSLPEEVLHDLDSPTNHESAAKTPTNSQRFQVPKSCGHVFSSLLFLATFVVVIVLEVVDLDEHPTSRRVTFLMVISCFLSAGFGIICLFTWVWVTHHLIWFAQFASICFVFFFGFTLVFLDRGLWQAGAVYIGISVVMAVWLWLTTRKGGLQFTGCLLEMIADFIKRFPSIVVVTAMVLLAQAVWLAVFSIAFIQTTKFQHYGTFYVVLGFIFYWTTQVFKHIVHVSVAGTFSHWYFQLPDIEHQGTPFLCFRRALTYAFGSICFGSIFVAVVRLLWGITRTCMETRFCERWGSLCLFDRLYLLMKSSYQSFNKYAFYQIMAYSKSFQAASRDTWKNFCERGVDSIIAEDKVDTLLLLPAIGGGSFVASICGIWAYYEELDDWSIMALAAFWVGFSIVSLTTELMEAVSTTLLSTFAEEPQPLATINSLVFHRFVRISEFSPYRTKRLDTI